MMKESVIVRYDGPALTGHRMDVGDLAPALLGLADLCKIANAKFNHDDSSVKVLISVDEEQKCFQFGIDVVQILHQAQNVIANPEFKTANDILKFIGVVGGVGGAAGGAVLGLLRLLKILKSKPDAALTMQPTVHGGQNVVQITINGDKNHVQFVWPETVALLKDETAVAAAKRVVEPVTKDGYEKLEFESGGVVTEIVNKAEARQILDYVPSSAEELLGEPQTITAFVKVYAPVYDVKAPRWRFTLSKDSHPYIDISETDIAARALERGGALLNDTYKVHLEIQQTQTVQGEMSTRYKVKEVLEFFPAQFPYQHNLIAADSPKQDDPPQVGDKS